MSDRPSILAPIDFSEASAGALRYAAALADHVAARLIVLAVEDPQLTDAADPGTGAPWTAEGCTPRIKQFAVKTIGGDAATLKALECEAVAGQPASEILRFARARRCDLIVISRQGLAGRRKQFFGSTTGRILRETTTPVLITPPADPGPIRIDGARRLIRRILVPVDLSWASIHQTQMARRLAEALGARLILAHVIEPMKSGLAARLDLAQVEADRRSIADDAMGELMGALPLRLQAEALVAYGDPAEELAKVAYDRQAGLIVMGLHGSPLLGPRMGSVTYRLLCLCPTLVLALPPRPGAVSASAFDAVCASNRASGPRDLPLTNCTPSRQTADGWTGESEKRRPR